jgi:hypothetical protein
MKCLGMKPGLIKVLTTALCASVVLAWLSIAAPLHAGPLTRVTLDGLTRAQGIREWIEITEPGNFGLLCMGIAGLLFGRWASGRKHGGPPKG